jgi:hypothetical protein
MDFHEWLNNVDNSGRSRFDYLDDFVESAALVELMEEAFNAGGNKDGTGDKPGKGKK